MSRTRKGFRHIRRSYRTELTHLRWGRIRYHARIAHRFLSNLGTFETGFLRVTALFLTE